MFNTPKLDLPQFNADAIKQTVKVEVKSRPSLPSAPSLGPEVHGVPLHFVEKLAREAGELVIKGFYSAGKGLNFKGSSDLVTEYDVAVEKLIAEHVKLWYPTHAFFGEETSSKDDRLTDAPTWVIDPIDGTTNFVHGIPFCCVSIGFVVDKKAVLGVVYNPILDEMFSAAVGHGAFLTTRQNKVRLDRSKGGPIPMYDAVVSFGSDVGQISRLRGELPADERLVLEKSASEMSHNFIATLRRCRDVRSFGCCSAEMTSVAMGRIDAVFIAGIHEWDIAASIVICEEANCLVTDMNGKSPIIWHGGRMMVSANAELAAEIGEQLEYQSVIERMGE
eukprot:GEMP01052283.1.p1 GENE.GEMP01052283.1~~GEMP01052283.1.p1  ORF type:complete len:348 (+),score=66.36 GEMP01052283.1:44-1045(+)